MIATPAWAMGVVGALCGAWVAIIAAVALSERPTPRLRRRIRLSAWWPLVRVEKEISHPISETR